MGWVADGWVPSAFNVVTDRGADPVQVNGLRRRALGVYQRQTQNPDVRVAYLVHIPTGFGLGAFHSRFLACLAADIADAATLDEDHHNCASASADILKAWQRAGFYISHAADDRGNPVWSMLADAPRGSEAA